MRRSPRLIRDNHERAGSPGSLPAPATPHHTKSGSALDDLIKAIEHEFQLGLRVRDKAWTPKQSDGAPLSDKVYGQIKHLFYSSRPTLDATLQNFREMVQGGMVQRDRGLLCLQHLLVKSKTRSPMSRQRTPASIPQKILTDVQSTIAPPVTAPAASSINSRLLRNYTNRNRHLESDSYQTAIEDPGSPTDVEDAEDAFFTPPSPTLDAMKRRDNAEPMQLIPSPIMNRKRPSGELSNDTSPKYTKTSEHTRATVQYPDLRDQLATGSGPSFRNAVQHVAMENVSAPTSANTSFLSNNTWSQQTMVNFTPNTSFGADGVNDGQFGPPLTKKSSLSNLMLNESIVAHDSKGQEVRLDNAMQHQQAPCLSQEQFEGIPSTYGSINDNDLASASLEAENKISGDLHGWHPIPAQCAPHSPVSQANKPDQAMSVVRPQPSWQGSIAPSTVTPYWLTEMPAKHLFVKAKPGYEVTDLPYWLAFICCRVSQSHDMALEQLVEQNSPRDCLHSPKQIWSQLRPYTQSLPQEPEAVWTAAQRSFEGFTFKGKVIFEKASAKCVFKLEPMPLQVEKSCLFQRMFGSERFLFLSFPSFHKDNVPSHVRGYTGDLTAQLKIWLSRTHFFMGRRWRAFYTDPIKKKNGKKNNSAARRVVLFATSGSGLKDMSLYDMINNVINVHKNHHQTVSKFAARLALGFSKTTPTVPFKPSELEDAPRIRADGSFEATEFDEEVVHVFEVDQVRPVMNDGCASISVGAAIQLWDRVGGKAAGQPLPSAFQGRIRGAKGVWTISALPNTTNPRDLAIWIEVTPDMLKYEPADVDILDDLPYNKDRLTFAFLKSSFVNGATDLHISFIPILGKQKALWHALDQLITRFLDIEEQHLLEALHDPAQLYLWIHEQGSLSSSSGILTWNAALPESQLETIKFLIENDFSPIKNPYLAIRVMNAIEQHHIRMQEKLRIPLGKATNLLGVADPLGVLNPGEVHIQFSKPFVDEFDGKNYHDLGGEKVLVARQPAYRPSDMQKMRAVRHERLSHLVDIIVFPRKGQRPAAGKLQGGDYDGDTFWTCWEPSLAEPFKNAKAPAREPDPAKYGIFQDKKLVGDIWDPSDPVVSFDRLTEEMLEAQMAENLLGVVANLSDREVYEVNNIASEKLIPLYDLRDLLVDANKQGFRFGWKELGHFNKEFGYGAADTPAYKEAMEERRKGKQAMEERKKGKQSGGDKRGKKEYNKENIIDHLLFEIIKPHHKMTEKKIRKKLPGKEQHDHDPVLRNPYLRLRGKKKTVFDEELDHLVKSIKKLFFEWNSIWTAESLTQDMRDKRRTELHRRFQSLEPSPKNAMNPHIEALTDQPLGDDIPNYWQAIRASTAFTMLSDKHAFVWNMAGRDLARLKSDANKNMRRIIPAILEMHKPKRKKVLESKGDDSDYSDDAYDSAYEELGG